MFVACISYGSIVRDLTTARAVVVTKVDHGRASVVLSSMNTDGFSQYSSVYLIFKIQWLFLFNWSLSFDNFVFFLQAGTDVHHLTVLWKQLCSSTGYRLLRSFPFKNLTASSWVGTWHIRSSFWFPMAGSQGRESPQLAMTWRWLRHDCSFLYSNASSQGCLNVLGNFWEGKIGGTVLEIYFFNGLYQHQYTRAQRICRIFRR